MLFGISIADDDFSPRYYDPKYNDLPAYLIEMQNGKLMPSVLVVPAKQKFRIIVKNIGTKPAEFESRSLRQEKVLYMGSQGSVLILPLEPGSYDYFDDFTPGAKGVIVAK